MPKFTALTKPILIELSKAYDLDVSGTRLEMCERLAEELKVTEIDAATLQNILGTAQPDIQGQINDIRNTLDQVLGAVDKLTNLAQSAPLAQSLNVGTTNTAHTSESDRAHDEVRVTNQRVISNHSTSQNQMVEEANIRTSMRDIISVLPDFDPNKAHPTSKQFITKVENLMLSYGWAEKVVLYAVQGVLKGHAKIWIDAQDVFETWDQFVTVFLNDFPCIENVADIHIQMMRTKQSKYESVVDYYYKILAFGRQGRLDDLSIIRHVINGIIDENTRKTLNALQYNTCPEFFKALRGVSLTSNVLREKNVFGNNENNNNKTYNDNKSPDNNPSNNNKSQNFKEKP